MAECNLPPSIYEAINESLPFGFWISEDSDYYCIELDAHISTATDFEKNFRNKLEILEKRLEKQAEDHSVIFKELEETFEVLNKQLSWSIRTRDVNKVLFYSTIIHVIFPVIIRSLSAINNDNTNDNFLFWVRCRIETGNKIVGFLEEVYNNFKKGDFIKNLDEEIFACLASTLIDHIALPQLIPKSPTNSNFETANNALQNALSILKRLPEKIINGYPTSYWMCKAFRHLAMAYIKSQTPIKALLLLSISCIFSRYINGKQFKELDRERLRGYAELYVSINDIGTADKYLNSTGYSSNTIGRYISDVKERTLENIKLNICLVRHAEKESDACKIFGFSGNPTYKGLNQQSAIIKGLSKIVTNKFTKCKIYTSDLLLEDAKSIKKELQDRVGKKLSVDYVSTKFWQPIDVGNFRGLDENEAKIKFPGEYQFLTDYRYGKCDGFKLSFPGGESVFTFEKRISIAFSEMVYEIAMNREEDALQEYFNNTLFILFGHTSSLTALLNIFAYYNSYCLEESEYKFYPIETGTIIFGSVDLKNHEVDFEARQPLLL